MPGRDVTSPPHLLQVVCGGMHTAALATDGTIYTWGVNDEGALGRPTFGESARKLWEACTATTTPSDRDLDRDGTGSGSGSRSGSGLGSFLPTDPYVQGVVKLPEDAARIVQLSAGDSHTTALAQDGTVYAWGTFRDASGVLGFSSSVKIQVAPVAVLGPRAAATTTTTSISKAVGVGVGVGVDVPITDPVMQVVSGDDHVLALTAKHEVYSWGNGQQGQLGRVGERVSESRRRDTYLTPSLMFVPGTRDKGKRIVEVQAGSYASFVRTENGTVFAAGLNNYGQLGVKEPVRPSDLQHTHTHTEREREI